MALQKQELVVPLGVTMNEGVPRELLPVGQLRKIQNGRVRKPGKLEKRYGFDLMAGGQGLDTTGSDITAPAQKLLRRDNELLLIDGANELHSYSAGRDRWKPRALAPEIQVKNRRIAGQNYYRGLIAHAVTARIGNYLAVAWDDTVGNDQVICRIYDESSGTLLLEMVDTTNRREPRLIAVGNYFVLAVSSGTAAPWAVRAFFLDTTDSTWAWSAVTTLTTAAATDTDTDQSWDIYPLDSTNFVFANVADTGGTLDLYRFSVDPFTLQDSELDIRTGKSITVGPVLFISLADTRIYVAYYNNTDNQVEVKGHSTTTLAQVFAAQTMATLAVDPTLVTIGPQQGGDAWVVWEINATGTTADMPGFGWRQINTSGSVHATTHDQRCLWPASRPFTYRNRSYMCVITGYGHPAGASFQHDQSALLVVDMGTDQVANSSYRVRPVARFAEGEVGSIENLTQPVSVSASDGIGYFAIPIRDPNAIWSLGQSVNATSTDIVNFQLPLQDETDTHWAGWQEFGTNTFVPSGLAHHYDGDLVREFWSYYPWIDQITLLTATGSLTVGLLHEYCAVWVAMDNQGRVWRSRPSIIRSATPVGTDRAIRLRISHYTATSQETAQGFDLVGIEIYRRTASTDPFTRLFRSGIGPAEGNNKLATTWLQVDDTGASHSIAGQPNLYTTGGVLEAFTPPPCVQSTVFDNRLWIFDGNVLWYTRELVDGEGPAFHPAQVIIVGDEADITAIAVMDANFVIFKEESIFLIQGTGPDDTGQGASYSVAQRITAGVGCVDFRSVCIGKDGIYFVSRRGIERLRRDVSTEYIGDRVEDSFEANSTITSAVYVQSDAEVRFTVAGGSGTCSALVYCELTDVWTVDRFHSDSVTVPLSAVCAGGLYYWLETDGLGTCRRTYKETPGTFSDEQWNGAAIVDKWITLSVETGDILLGQNPTGETFFWRTMLFSRRGGAHALSVEYSMNQQDSFATPIAKTVAQLAAAEGAPIELTEVLPIPQRARSIRFRFSDFTTIGADPVSPTQGPFFYAVTIEAGQEGGVSRVKVAQRG